jgi:hypothetical protein
MPAAAISLNLVRPVKKRAPLAEMQRPWLCRGGGDNGRGMSAFLLALLALSAGDRLDYGREVGDAVAIAECRKPSSENEIIVCGQRTRNRYAVTDPEAPFDPSGDTPSVMRERSSWVQEGDSGTQSCSAVGPGGWTVQQWKRQREQRAWR